MKIWHVLIAFITHWVILYCHRHPQHTSGSGDVFIIRLSEDIKQKPLMSHGVIYMPWQPLSSAIINPEILLILSKISENFSTWDGKGGRESIMRYNYLDIAFLDIALSVRNWFDWTKFSFVILDREFLAVLWLCIATTTLTHCSK